MHAKKSMKNLKGWTVERENGLLLYIIDVAEFDNNSISDM